MTKNFKNTFQNIHYNRQKPNFWLNIVLCAGEFCYGFVIRLKNFLYEKNILKEVKTAAYVICIGNLTTGGVGKTPIVAAIANSLAKSAQNEKIAIISRGYGAKLQNKTPNIIKDLNEIKFENGNVCGDEPFQLAEKVSKNVVVITCKNRKSAIDEAVIKFGCKIVIFDDGFSNRKVKKDRSILVIDSKMRFGNGHLLPKGPLREPIKEIKRADEIFIVDKGDENIKEAINWAKNSFKKKISLSKMTPKKIYNMHTKAQVLLMNDNKNPKTNAVAFCAIGQPSQFFDFAQRFYNLEEKITFNDHYKYSKNDIKELIKKAKTKNINIFITTQKDEAKLRNLTEDIKDFSFNVLELETSIVSII